MKASSSKRGLQVLLGIMALVMFVAGALGVLFGASWVPREGVVTPDVDTEMRFFAVWYAAAGVILYRAIARLESSTATVRLIGSAFFLAGCARILSWIVVGRPHPQFIVLMVLELVLPLVIFTWHASLVRGGRNP